MFKVVDYKTQAEVTPRGLVFTGEDCPWEIKMDIEQVRSRINLDYLTSSPPSLSKYLPFLPIQDWSNFTSLQEGASPLLRSKSIGERLGCDLYFKLESKNPTGSFKDRGSAVEVTVAKELGAKGIAVASTGNMAASCACYAARAKIPCFVFVPEDVPQSKLAQVISFGGRVVKLKGDYNAAAKIAQEVAYELDFYLAGDYAFRIEGAKTAAFEIVEQLSFKKLDKVCIPMGCGTNLSSYAKGFKEFQLLGLVDTLPQLIGVQAQGANAIVRSFENGNRDVQSLSSAHTIASAIAVANPVDGMKALDAIYESNGSAIGVSDQEMLQAQYELATKEGLFTEPSGGAALASLLSLAEQQDLSGQTIVCVLCGDGLKDPSAVLNVALKPPTINPEISEFVSLYEGGAFSGKSVTFVEKDKVLFSAPPAENAVRTALLDVFETKHSDQFVSRVRGLIEGFLKKGKAITYADFQDIVQDAGECLEHKTAAQFSVVDFKVHTSKDQQASAEVTVSMSGAEHSATGQGVGPVDAVINALRKCCAAQTDFGLSKYAVTIRSHGTDAVVYAEMKLQRNGSSSLGHGASPDIIQASIEAFEEAYNGFYEAK
ncbi:MAG: threonine synthase [Bdellovibrionales bacterium]|nr:threonine synthase [Bdellovibrionales bacterium]